MTLTLDRLVLAGAVLALLYLISAPLLMTVFAAFRGPVDFLPFEPGAPFTLDNIRQVYTNGWWCHALASEPGGSSLQA